MFVNRERTQRKGKHSFHISIGDEGAVAVYCSEKSVIYKVFAPSTAEKDIAKLKQLISQDKRAPIHIYLDTSDQMYVQKSLPAVSAMGVGKIAQKRLDREFPKGYLKTCVQIGRASIGRKDWIYTFVAATINQQFNQWIEFLSPFDNIIKGIYFLPIEYYKIIKSLSDIEKKGKTTSGALSPLISKLKSLTSGDKNKTANKKWEIILSHNKTGGYRQAAFQDGNIIFSRMIENFQTQDADVIAGNIEQEVENTIEYLGRLGLEEKDSVDLYIILCSEISGYIRTEKFKVENVFIYTPFQLSKALNVPNSSAMKDKFIDPAVLGFMAKSKTKIITVHTAVTKKINNYALIVQLSKYLLLSVAPIIIISKLVIGYEIFTSYQEIKKLKTETKQSTSAFSNALKLQRKEVSNIDSTISIEQINEIVDIYTLLSENVLSPIELAYKFAAITPKAAKIKAIEWSFKDPVLFNVTNAKAQKIPFSAQGRYHEYKLDFNVILQDDNFTLEGLNEIYSDYSQGVINTFNKHKVTISELPKNFSFSDIKKTNTYKNKNIIS